MNDLNEFAYTRGLATFAAQTQIGTPLVLEEMTLPVWEARLAAIITQKEVAQDRESDLNGKRGELDVQLGLIVTLARQTFALAKGKWRNDDAKLAYFRNIRFESNGRPALLTDVCAVESGWEGADAAWVPITEPGTPPVPITLTLFKTRRLAVETLLKQETLAEGSWSAQEKVLNALCGVLNADNVAWYAAAVILFPEGTAHGDLIRATIPTTYSPPAAPPGVATFTHAGSPAPGSLTAGLAAPGAATFDFYRKGPGEAAFVKVVDLSQNHEYSASGLAAGTYLLKGQGHNSGGYGPMSAERAVVVG